MNDNGPKLTTLAQLQQAGLAMLTRRLMQGFLDSRARRKELRHTFPSVPARVIRDAVQWIEDGWNAAQACMRGEDYEPPEGEACRISTQ